VLNLEIEFAHKPAERFIIAGKVVGCNRFVNHPVLINHVPFMRYRVVCLLNYMCKPKDKAVVAEFCLYNL